MKQEKVSFTASDGFELKGLWLQNEGNGQATAMINPATSVKKEFYLKFATYLVAQGYNVLLYDYRGIGESIHGPLKDMQAKMHEYGTLDQNAALDFLVEEKGKTGIVWIGHSVGSQMMGVVEKRDHLQQVVSINSSTGYWGYFPFPWNLVSLFLWHVAGPLLTIFKGYFPAAVVGMGESLPRGVFYEWRKWCNSRYHFRDWVTEYTGKDRFYDFKVPITSIFTSDDYIAGDKTVAALQDFYPNSSHKTIKVQAKDMGGKMSHFGIFRSKFSEKAWPLILAEMKGTTPIPAR